MSDASLESDMMVVMRVYQRVRMYKAVGSNEGGPSQDPADVPADLFIVRVPGIPGVSEERILGQGATEAEAWADARRMLEAEAENPFDRLGPQSPPRAI